MVIKQEETSLIQDAFDNNKLNVAFNVINTMAGDITVDTEQLKTYCEETVKLINKFISEVEAIEKKQQKSTNVDKFKEKLFGHDSLG